MVGGIVIIGALVLIIVALEWLGRALDDWSPHDL